MSGTRGAAALALATPPLERARIAPGGPLVCVLDARRRSLDEDGLRGWARAESAALAGANTSRSYSFPYAVFAWHDGPVGVDIERVARCDERFAESIATPAELARAREVPDDERDRYVTAMWSSKEAVAKALGDALAYDPRRLDAPMLWPDGSAGPWRCAALDVDDGYVGWVCWRAAAGS